ncbi:MAG: helix-turn-helix domain-containing protein, partial [Clostridiales bacterium]|nr:helix-turn-helix domain-containing protein [Clostridiales bacterium]
MPFLLNMQIIYDAAAKRYPGKVEMFGEDRASLENVRMYQSDVPLQPRFIYLAAPEDIMDSSFYFHKDVALILCGEDDEKGIPKDAMLLRITAPAPLSEIFTLVQDIFERYQRWDQQLKEAYLSEHPLDAMMEASLPILGNPLFVHDPDFYVLSCPRHVPGMLIWTRDKRTGRDIVPLSQINDFKVDPDYLYTLSTHGASLFPKEQRGYPILYINLWNGSQYQGRICVDELENPIEPGHYAVLDYLGHMTEEILHSKTLFRLNFRNELQNFFVDYLEGKIKEPAQLIQALENLNWKQNDRYLCFRMEGQQKDIQMLSTAATLNYIETLIPNGYVFIHREGITVIVNLSYTHARMNEVISSFAILLREGLMKMGVSSELRSFPQLPQGYTQACMALELGQQSNSTAWCYRFDDYILDYLAKEGTKQLSPELLCSSKLSLLTKYDEKNNTDLYHTLRLFLENERNILKTSRELFIHRSTLLYRLERIRKVANVNLDDPAERLILSMSFYIHDKTD